MRHPWKPLFDYELTWVPDALQWAAERHARKRHFMGAKLIERRNECEEATQRTAEIQGRIWGEWLDQVEEDVTVDCDCVRFSSVQPIEDISTVALLAMDVSGFLPGGAAIDNFQVLHRVFEEFDAACEAAEVTKVKSSGTTYIATGRPLALSSGLSAEDQVLRLLRFLSRCCDVCEGSGTSLQIAAAVHVGRAVGAFPGLTRSRFDLYGSTVTKVLQVKNRTQPGRIALTDAAAKIIGADAFASAPIESLPAVESKGGIFEDANDSFVWEPSEMVLGVDDEGEDLPPTSVQVLPSRRASVDAAVAEARRSSLVAKGLAGLTLHAAGEGIGKRGNKVLRADSGAGPNPNMGFFGENTADGNGNGDGDAMELDSLVLDVDDEEAFGGAERALAAASAAMWRRSLCFRDAALERAYMAFYGNYAAARMRWAAVPFAFWLMVFSGEGGQVPSSTGEEAAGRSAKIQVGVVVLWGSFFTVLSFLPRKWVVLTARPLAIFGIAVLVMLFCWLGVETSNVYFYGGYAIPMLVYTFLVSKILYRWACFAGALIILAHTTSGASNIEWELGGPPLVGDWFAFVCYFMVPGMVQLATVCYHSEKEARAGFHVQMEVHQTLEQLNDERAKREQSLLMVLPPGVLRGLREGVTVESFAECGVLVADFGALSAELGGAEQPHGAVTALCEAFAHFDKTLIRGKGALPHIEKVKTMDDQYVCVSGFLQTTEARDGEDSGSEMARRRSSHVAQLLALAGRLHRASQGVRELSRFKGAKLRIGIHVGPLMGGVIGSAQVTYDVFGDAVMMAQRARSNCGEARQGTVLSAAARAHVRAHAARMGGADCEFGGRALPAISDEPIADELGSGEEFFHVAKDWKIMV